MNYKSYKGLVVEKNIPYSNMFPKECVMDFIYPAETKEVLPVLINFHGGGFVKGDKKYRKSICQMFASEGWFVINANYRMAPEFAFPAPFEDAFNLLNIMPEIAAKYKLNLNRVVFMGDSSGGYMATMTVAALTNEAVRKGLELPECKIKPAGLLSFCAPYDVISAIDTKLPLNLQTSIAESVTGLIFRGEENPLEFYPYVEYLSPFSYIGKNWCPTFVAHCEHDILCKGHGEKFIEKIKNVGVYVDEVYASGKGSIHCYHLFPYKEQSKETLRRASSFLEVIRLGKVFSTKS
jgi:acetyl esterase/lipase